MKYFILLCDGMADYKLESLGNRTPMEAAVKPCMDELASKSFCGLVSNVPEGMVPESDTANLAVMSYDPAVYSKGRSPLEAVRWAQYGFRSDGFPLQCSHNFG